jgi:hypothetical protein
MEKISHLGWENCYRLANDTVELIITADVGPRIIHYGLVGQENEFKVFDDHVGRTGDKQWLSYGGHRLWHAPEVQPRTYYPDNAPVHIESYAPNAIAVIAPVESTTGIQKEIRLSLDGGSRVTVQHFMHNHNPWEVTLALWSITVMNPGGTSIMPLPPRGPHPENLQPTSRLALWAYTDMSDERFTWGQNFILLRQDSQKEYPQKFGALNTDGWLAYANHNHLFVKTFIPMAEAIYPDLGANAEIFTNSNMLELETLSPLEEFPPDTSLQHTERWYLFDNVLAPHSDADVEKAILPLIGGIT